MIHEYLWDATNHVDLSPMTSISDGAHLMELDWLWTVYLAVRIAVSGGYGSYWSVCQYKSLQFLSFKLNSKIYTGSGLDFQIGVSVIGF